jgi:PTH2 family peptidyl-tRNA hydrolase
MKEMEWPCFNFAFGGFAFGIVVGFISPKLKSVIYNRVLVHLNQPTKMVVVVRNNLGMGKGKIASQCAHAAVECYKTGLKTDHKIVKIWLASGQPKVVVKVDTEEELLSIAAISTKKGLINCLIKDAGKTQLEPYTTTVLGIGPGKKQDIDLVTGHLKLL